MNKVVAATQKIDEQFSNVSNEFKSLVSISILESFIFGRPMIDIQQTDENLSKADPEYNFMECTYQGEKTSMKEYVRQKYGDDAVKFIEVLINGPEEEG